VSQPIEADEVIPPSAPRIKPPGSTDHERHVTARIIAHWLDELLHIPGTQFKVGLDPFLSLVPGVGDFLSSSVSAVVIIESVRKGVAFSVIMRMCLNMLVNALFDAVPVAGSFLSVFFKSNSRNLTLLQRWQEGEHQAVKRSSRMIMLVVVIVICLSIALSLLIWGLYIWGLMKLVRW
jgi:hypothetical protein